MNLSVQSINDVLQIYQDKIDESDFDFGKFWKEMNLILKSKYNVDSARFFGKFFDELDRNNLVMLKGIDIPKVLDTLPERWKKERVSDTFLMKGIPPKLWGSYRDKSWVNQHVKGSSDILPALKDGASLGPEGRGLTAKQDKKMKKVAASLEPKLQKKLDGLKKIVEEKTAGVVDGVKVDLFSASHVLQVFDRINEQNQKKYLSMPVAKILEIAFKLLK
jgi:hypothetical protein